MKLMFSFLIGLVVGGLLIAGVMSAVLTKVQSVNYDTGLPSNVSSLQEEGQEIQEEQSEGGNIIGILPDIRKIYHEALVSPFQKVEQEIHDEDIAQFYRELIESCGLAQP